ncbi:MAG: hypothetical protein LBN43_06035, partial [Oscillospiraceae bacterium]|nr:hypothetical protein [Oscillospiraceae bacterium]
MDWFTAWWNELGLLGQALACVAIPGTMLLVVQTILLLVGGAFGHDSDHGADFSHDHDSGFDHDGDTDFGHDHDLGFAHSSDGDFDDLHDMSHAEGGMRVFTVRGLVAFLAVGGWTGLAVWENTRNPTGSIVSALLAGSAAVVFAACCVRLRDCYFCAVLAL